MPFIRYALGLSFLAAAALALIGSLAACGRKGDIIPPGTVLPAQVNDLHAEPRAGRALLAWTMPAENTASTPLTDLAGFDVLRARLADGTEECDCEYVRIGTIDLESPERALIKGRRVVWPDPGLGLESGGGYGYRVRAFNADGYRGPESNTASLVFLPPPPAPERISAVPGDRSVRLSWREIPAGENALAGYNVYRAGKPGEPMTRPVNRQPVLQASYTDTGLVNGAGYYYRVTALTGSAPPYSEGPPSEELRAVPEDIVAPEAPAWLQAVPSVAGVLISWLPSMDPDVAGYVLYRKGPEEPDFRPLPGMPVKGITYTDADVREGGAYAYAVSALDNAAPPNESLLSEEAGVVVPSAVTP